MNPERAKRLYRDSLFEPVTIRRITGSGSARTVEDYTSHGRVFDGERRELVGGIAQQDLKAVVDATQLYSSGLLTDVKLGDWLIDMDGRELTVTEVKVRRVKAVTVGYELTLRA